MTETWALAALWIGLALFAALASIWLRVATALSEIVVGTLAQFAIGGLFGAAVLAADQPWIKFLAGAAAIVLTFLAGAELDPQLFRRKWKEATAVGLISFVPCLRSGGALAPRLGSDGELARWGCHVDDVGRCGLRGDDRVRVQHHRLRQDGARRLLCHRPRH